MRRKPLLKDDIICNSLPMASTAGGARDAEILDAVIKSSSGGDLQPIDRARLPMKRCRRATNVSSRSWLSVPRSGLVRRTSARLRGTPEARALGKEANSVGTLLDDRFEIMNVIAKSSMASLFKALMSRYIA